MKSTHRLTVRYLVALLLLVLMNLLIFAGAENIFRHYSSEPGQIVAAVRLETVAHNLEGDLLQITLAQEPAGMWHWHSQAVRDLEDIASTYGALMGAPGTPPSGALRVGLRDGLRALGPDVQAIQQEAGALMALPQRELRAVHPDDLRFQQVHQATAAFLDGMDGVVRRIAMDTRRHVFLHTLLDALFLVLNLGALVVLGVFVIHPMAADIQRGADHLASANAQLSAKVREQEEARQSALESQELLRSITDSAQDPILIVDDSGSISFWNQAAEQVFGYSAAEALGMAFDRLIVRDEAGTWLAQALGSLVHGPTGAVPGGLLGLTALRRGGERFQCELSLSVVHVKGRWNAVAIARDVSERRRAEEQLLGLGTAVEQSAESIIITDPDGVIQYVNPAFEKLTGYTREEAQQRTPGILKSGRHDAAFYRQLWDTILAGSIWSGHLVNRRKDGTLFEEDATISPVRDSEGDIISYIAVKRDVTERMQLEAQLRQSQKLEAIGTLVGGIAHDFNNVLTPIVGFTELAISRVPPVSREREYLNRIYASAQRARDLIAQILLFSRKGETRRRPLELARVVTDTLKLLRSSLPATVEMNVEIPEHLPTVVADGTQLYTLLMNLCINAAHAMPDGGTLQVSVAELALTDLAGQDGQKISGHYLRLRVRDTGVGMDEHVLSRIFEPFFTTKEASKGTGLGLSTVYGIVKQHDGVIRVHSRPGEGSTFDVYLPAQKTGETEEDARDGTAVPVSGITALVVDDEEAITCFTADVLQGWGCRVTVANGGEAALSAFQRNQSTFDVVLSDQVMPGMTGDRLVATLRRMRADLPAVIMTGNGDVLPESATAALRQTAVLRKPFSRRELSRTLAQVLRTGAGGDPPV